MPTTFKPDIVRNARLLALLNELTDAGSFTGTLTGCTTSPTASVFYGVAGDVVTLELPTLNGTSNTTACTITGMPADIQPDRQCRMLTRIQDNGAVALGTATVETSGVITLGSNIQASAFTASGTKGSEFTCVTYYRSS